MVQAAIIETKTTQPSRRFRRRHWVHEYAESQLVLATADCGRIKNTKRSTITREIRSSEEPATSTLVTPSPLTNSRRQRFSSKKAKKESSRKQLFTKISTTTKHVIEEEQKEGENARRRLFVNKNTSSSKTSNNSGRSSMVQSRQVASTCWDSLASVSSSLQTTVRLKTTRRTGGREKVKKKAMPRRKISGTLPRKQKALPLISPEPLSPSTQPSLEANQVQEEQQMSSRIPPELVSVLAPLGLSRTPRSCEQIMADHDKEIHELAKKRASARANLHRACKDRKKVQNYSEESDDDEVDFGGAPDTSESSDPEQRSKTAQIMKALPKPSRDELLAHSLDETAERTTSRVEPYHSTMEPSQTRSHVAQINAKSTDESKARKSKTKATKMNVKHKVGRLTRRKKEQSVTPASKKATTTKSRSTTGVKESSTRKESTPRYLTRSIMNQERNVIQRENENQSVNHATKNRVNNPVTPDRSTITHHERTKRATEETHVSRQRKKRSRDKKCASKKSKFVVSTENNAEVASLPIQDKPNQQQRRQNQSIIQVTSESSKRKKSKKKKSKKKKSKVRFAPLPEATTTTFSIKIRVKTSANPSYSHNQQKRMITSPLGLDQSTMQSITNQIAQACVTAQANNRNYNNNCDPMIMGPPANNYMIENGTRQAFRQLRREKEKPLEVEVDCDTSIISDLTRERDRNKVAASRTRSHSPPVDYIEGGAIDFGGPRNDGDLASYRDELVSTQDVEERKWLKPRRVPFHSIPQSSSRRRFVQPLCAATTRLEIDETSIASSKKRKMLHYSDSLAGGSLVSENASIMQTKVPTEVSVNRQSSRLSLSAASMPRELASRDRCPDETVVTNYSVSPKKNACCKCDGCRRKYDCLNCDNCVIRLQTGEKNSGEIYCMKRVCQQLARRQYAQMDSLGMAASRYSQQLALTPKVDDDDDDDDDFSYVSEIAWGDKNKTKNSKRVKRISRAARLWGNSGFASKQMRKIIRPTGVVAGSTSSVTTLTGTSPPSIAPPLSTQQNFAKGRSKKRKGRKKDPLHYMERPMPTDGSVASWMEGRKHLRALMHYDEADQDWV